MQQPLFQSLDQARISQLLTSHWQPVSPDHRPLGPLQSASLGEQRLLVLAGPRNQVGALYLQVFLVDSHGAIAEEPLALGLCNSGPYPAFNWVELVRYQPVVSLAGASHDLRGGDQELAFFRLLGGLIPPGGHLMVEYDSPTQRETARILSAGFPAPCSPLGYALLHAGCLNFRDWYIPEGGSEGPRKLQGFKPLNEAIARQRKRELEISLQEVLQRPRSQPWEQAALKLGQLSLRLLQPS
ncbi:MAG TPA: DUF1122 family protein [Dehalococcoidia bacterium]|nr:DUF1122 family protein [Dehalococcoidia bacterium]